jgi:hypothetical protein
MANASVTVTGTPEAPVFNFDIPQGEKGDPGGFNYGTDLSSIHLDTIFAPGLYRQSNGSNVSTALGYPTTGNTGILTVMASWNDTSRIVQTFETVAAGGGTSRQFWKRTYYSTQWYPWRVYNSTRVDTTAGRAIYQWDDLNQREQLIYGDTGLRSIYQDQPWLDALFNTGTTINSSNVVRVRRVGYVVQLAWALDKAASGSVTSVAGFPLGFRPADIFNAIGITSGIGLVRAYHPGGASQLITQSAAAQTNVSVTLTYTTTDPWPTSLPGTAIGSIPST